jgi:TfoX/Sxy family transcriptional regulator of competence genes
MNYMINSKKNIKEFPVAPRKMFRGIGGVSESVMFALIYDGIVYLKSPIEVAEVYSADSSQFEPPFRRTMKMPYWSVPEKILRNQNLFS